MPNILITGGFGFIGLRLVKHFKNKGYNIIVLEHHSSTAPSDLPDCAVVRADITNEEEMKNLKVKDIDAVLHLAAQSSGPKSFSIPATDIKLNVLGTLNTIDFCVSNSIKRLHFASSFVIYGDHPEKESLNESTCCKPKSVYAGSKLAAEHLLMNYAQPKGIQWNALRMFNVYGPGQDITKPDQGVVGIFLNMLMKQDSVQVKGSLERFRDLVHIEDVIQGWDLCLEKGIPNKAYNLGSGFKTTFKQLITEIAIVLGKGDKLVIEELTGMPGDMMGCYADTMLISSDLGYNPKFDLKRGLADMIQWVRTSV